MAKRSCCCGLCEINSPPAACTSCVNLRLAERYKLLKRKIYERDVLRRRLDAELKAKKEAENYQHWRHGERRTKLLACLEKSERLLLQNKQKYEMRKSEYEALKRLIDAAAIQLQRRKKELLEQFYPDSIRALVVRLTTVITELNQTRRHYFRHLVRVYPISYVEGDSGKFRGDSDTHALRICGARLPIRDDFHSVTVEDLSASLGYMVQLVHLAARFISAPVLHNAAFAASSSRIWIRNSYWDVHPPSRSEEYPLFRKGRPSAEAAYRAEGILKPKFLRALGSDSNHSESDRDVRHGLRILKRSISCICVYGFNVVLGIPVPSNLSTFETFMELLSILASKKHRPRLQRPVLLNNNSTGAEAMKPEDSFARSSFSCRSNDSEALLRNQEKSRVDISDFFCVAADLKSFLGSSKAGAAESCSVDEWDVVDHPVLPPPSQAEDIEHWTRAMITDATK